MVEVDTKTDVLRVLLKNGGMSKIDVMRILGISDTTFQRVVKELKADDWPIMWVRKENKYRVGLPEIPDPLETELLTQIEKLGITPEDMKSVLKNLKDLQPRKYKPLHVEFSDWKIKFGVITDLHGGHQCYRPDVLTHARENFERQEVDFILNCGDTIEGMSNREGHINELDIIGTTAQVEYMADQFEQFGETGMLIHSIEADGSHTGWSRVKGNQGGNAAKELENESKYYKFLGWNQQDMVLSNGVVARLRHPGSGTAYAISYKMQKYLESLGGGDKPNIVFNGHYHKMLQMFHRNIHAFECGTLENQTPYMGRLGTPAHVGYWIVEVTLDESKEGQTQTKLRGKEAFISSVKAEFTPFYD